jgi:acyl transferase domain-containing protein/NADPH:quinone reductase-like Zn-dependent oxidoreductase/acyl carrier protein
MDARRKSRLPIVSSSIEGEKQGDRSGNVDEPVAVVGIGCRYADARGPEEFWEIVRTGRNTVRDAPQHRIDLGYDIDHFYDPRPRIPGKISSKKGGFLEHPELFDPAAFGIAPRDALTMEPQQRLMVEVTWDALEDAGIVPDQIVGERVAVMLGYMAEDYSRERAGVLGEEAVYRGHDVFTVGGMSHAVLSGRIAFLLGVTGPSFTLDTACSSSLITTHLACQSLRRGESELALAGGVNLFLSPEGNIALSRSGMLSNSGSCRAFDASADGFVRAEGAGVVVLKRLSDALRDANPIYAVIRGSGICSDGRDGGHMMAPGRKGQAQAMRDAYAQAGVNPADIQYVEAHGTGTMIGDPVEIGALADVMGPGRDREKPLRVASVKGNLGHTESASGVAGLIRACLSIRHRELHAQLHYKTPNPVIPWGEIPVRVQSESTPWPVDGQALAGVNSFGISGTNAHVVLEGPPDPNAGRHWGVAKETGASKNGTRPTLLPISGHDSNALHDMVEATRRRLEDSDATDLEDVVHTYAERRTHRSNRLTVIGTSPDSIRSELDAYLAGEPTAAIQSGLAPGLTDAKLVMVFPGQGSQWIGMGHGLIEREPVFAASINRLDAAFSKHVDWSLRAVLTGELDYDWRDRLDVLQPVLVAVEIALAELWASWGIRPARVIGQSLGEIAAAFVAGILDEPDMALLACHRGNVVARAAGKGTMAVVSLSRAAVQERLSAFGGRVEVAGINSPTTTIVSGDRREVSTLVESLESEGLFARLLAVDFASHCFQMDPLLEDFHAGIAGIEPRAGKIPFHSTVDGMKGFVNVLGPDYWVQNLRSAVAFDSGVGGAIEEGGEIFLEVSPHPALPRAIDEISQSVGGTSRYVSSLTRDEDESDALARSLASLHIFGLGVDFGAYGSGGRVVEVPLYAYQRERYWFSVRNRLDRFRPTHPMLGEGFVSSLDPRLRSWDFALDADTAGFVADLRVDGSAVLQAGVLIEIALAASTATFPDGRPEIRDLTILRPIRLEEGGRRQVQVVLREGMGGAGQILISSRDRQYKEIEWELHATCQIERRKGMSAENEGQALDRTQNESVPIERWDSAMESSGVWFGPRANTLRELQQEPSSAILGKLMLPRTIEAEWYAFEAHPALLESAFQLAGLREDGDSGVSIESIERVAFEGGLGSDCWCRVDEAQTGAFDYVFFDREGSRIGSLHGVRLRTLSASAAKSDRDASLRHRVAWTEQATDSAQRPPVVERWILVSDDMDEASLLATELSKRGAECRFCEKADDLAALSRWTAENDSRPWGLALLAWKEPEIAGAGEPEGYRKFRVGSWASAIREHTLTASEIWIATRGLQTIDGDDSGLGEIGWNIAREIETFTDGVEMQRCRLFDASANLHPLERLALAKRMGAQGEERQFMARGERIYVPRLAETAPDGASPDGSVPRIEVAGGRNFSAIRRGNGSGISQWVFAESAEPSPGPAEIVVEVRSVALSQLDVLADLGLAKAETAAVAGVGRDFSGFVTAVGQAVDDLTVGDPVVGICEGALVRRLVVERARVARKPALLGFTEASSLPYTFLVARYALSVVGRLRAGERCLVASSSGGVAEAVMSVARSIGAAVTAISRCPARRRELEEQGIRVIAPLESIEEDSRFEDDEEFDLIVGAVSGAALHGLVDRLASGGRYLDLCPRLQFERPEIGALRLGANRSISAIDTRELIQNDPDLVAALLEETVTEAERGHSRSIPVTVFPVASTSRALRLMAQNRHAGRVCLDLTDAAGVEIECHLAPPVPLSERGGLLVSGEAGRFRDGVVEWLEREGVDPLVVSSEDEVVRAFEEGTGDFESRAGWIHIGRDSRERPDLLRTRIARCDAPLRIMVSIRSRIEGVPAIDRAWETHLWLDQLSRFRSRKHGGWVDVSISESGSLDPLLDFMGDASRGVAFDSPVVLLESGELDRREAEAPSPIFEVLMNRTESTSLATITRSSFLGLTPPERGRVMQDFVLAEISNVLGLREGQRQALDPLSRLDALGLDSLMSMELFVGLGRSLEMEITRDWFEAIPTLSEIGVTLADRYAKSEVI